MKFLKTALILFIFAGCENSSKISSDNHYSLKQVKTAQLAIQSDVEKSDRPIAVRNNCHGIPAHMTSLHNHCRYSTHR